MYEYICRVSGVASFYSKSLRFILELIIVIVVCTRRRINTGNLFLFSVVIPRLSFDQSLSLTKIKRILKPYENESRKLLSLRQPRPS